METLGKSKEDGKESDVDYKAYPSSAEPKSKWVPSKALYKLGNEAR